MAAAELGAVAMLLGVHVWTDSSAVLSKPMRTVVSTTTVLCVGTLFLRSRPTLARVGLRPHSWSDGLGVLATGTAVAVAALFIVGAWRDTLFSARDLGRWTASVWHLQVLQQLMLNAFVAPRAAAVAGGDGLRAAMGAATLFAALHLPNPLLTCLSFFAALGWREWYRRHPNLPAVWASHFALSFAVMATQDSDLLRRMRVGAAYLYFRD